MISSAHKIQPSKHGLGGSEKPKQEARHGSRIMDKPVDKKPSASGPNKPDSQNSKSQGPVTPAGQKTSVRGVTDATGSTTTKGDPSFTPQGSANKGSDGVKINAVSPKGKVTKKEMY